LIGRGGSNVISRHLVYAELLDKETSGRSSLKVSTLKPEHSLSDDASDAFLTFSNLFMWFFGTASFIFRNRSAVSWLVAGNPWESFWLALIMKLTLCRSAKIQVQFHGDFYGSTWKTLARRNSLRFKTLTIVSSFCDSARFVGRDQESKALRICPQLRQKTFVSPLQFSLGKFQPNSFRLSSHFTVGVVGRLHPDKGVDNALRFIGCLKALNYSFSIVFIGDGPLKEHIRARLEVNGVSHKLTGHLIGGELDEIWRSLDLVLSLAPAESYGLVPREALSRGKRVVGVQNAGINDLKMELPEWSGLEVLPEDWDCNSVELVLQRLELHLPLTSNRELFEFQLREALHRLIKSWA
jgi:glycosyltransferase involved in cell wall biosynthesis